MRDFPFLGIRFQQICFGSPEYGLACELRDRILRAPLGLTLSAQDLANEDQALHFGLFTAEDVLIACVVAALLDPLTVKLRQMVVEPAHQGQGYGKALLEQVEVVLQQRGVRRVVLHGRKTAIGFYQRLGYRVEGPEFVEVTVPHYRMEKLL
ncbi:MAG: GNAT family N-acetyltransferase [Cyanobacteria bacterium Co-bin13]|nr:GNAT family N-acetyltransferase [Cyanobacteria bacterium Co-bin13]